MPTHGLPIPPDFSLPKKSVIAIPRDGLVLYRLVRRDPPTRKDFPYQRLETAAERETPEILRLGFSHFFTPEAAAKARRSPETPSPIARVILRPSPRVHVAKTTNNPNHVTVWAPVELLLTWVDAVLTDV